MPGKRAEGKRRNNCKNDGRNTKRRGGGGYGGGHGGGSYQYQPKRGGAGILLTCEVGRERKCQLEGIDILTHYYRLSCGVGDGDGDGDGTNANTNTKAGADQKGDIEPAPNATPKKTLSLDEEIRLLQRGVSTEEVLNTDTTATVLNTDLNNNSHQHNAFPKRKQIKKSSLFTVYETGCRGTVVLMFNENAAAKFINGKSNGNGANNSEDTAVEKEESETAVVAKESNVDQTITCTNDAPTNTTKNETEVPNTTATINTNTTTTITNANVATKDRFNPLAIMQRIIANICQPHGNAAKNNDAPSSRFVTRMIPLQTTCFAKISDIELAAKELIDTYLTTTRTIDNDNKHQPVIETETKAVVDKEKVRKKRKRTFAIQFHKRICSSVSRTDVITAVAALMDPELYDVDLKHPEYTIIIEVCRTLVGMSIVPTGDGGTDGCNGDISPEIRKLPSFEKFNVLELRQFVENDQT